MSIYGIIARPALNYALRYAPYAYGATAGITSEFERSYVPHGLSHSSHRPLARRGKPKSRPKGKSPKNKILYKNRMPYRRTYRRRTYRRKPAYKKRSYPLTRHRVSRAVVPDRMFRKLTMSGYSALEDTGQTGAIFEHVIQMNGISDPYSAGNRQPLGYDQLAALYTKYYVSACKVTIFFSRVSGTGTTYVGLHVNDSLTDTQDHYWKYIERPNTVIKQLTPGIDKGTLSIFRNIKSIAKPAGGSIRSDIDNYHGTLKDDNTGTDPTLGAFCHIFAEDYGSDDFKIEYIMRVTYYVTVYDRVALPFSAD
jgi:hypothetical protein